MKNIKKTQSTYSRTDKLFGLFLLLVIIGTLFALARTGIIKVPGLTADATPQNVVQVGYIDVAAAAGTDVSSVIKFKDIMLPDNVDDEVNAIIPDDAITPSDDLTGYALSVDLSANTPLSWSLICPVDTDYQLNDTARYVEVPYITLGTGLEVGDYIDVRLKTYNGAKDYDYSDYIVVAKKEIVAIDGTNVTLKLNEDELILLTAAAVDMTISNASKDDTKKNAVLYTTEYISVTQEKAKVTYSNSTIVSMLKSNPNLINNPTALYQTMMAK